jgi:hypothetical protein
MKQTRSEGCMSLFCQEDAYSRVDSFRGTNNATLDARLGLCNSSKECGFKAGIGRDQGIDWTGA